MSQLLAAIYLFLSERGRPLSLKYALIGFTDIHLPVVGQLVD
jgi:hypothetical protein